MSFPIIFCSVLAALLIWRLYRLNKARPMGMIVSFWVVLDLGATAISAMAAGISIHFLLNWDERFTGLLLFPALVSMITLVIGFIAANETRRRGGQLYVSA